LSARLVAAALAALAVAGCYDIDGLSRGSASTTSDGGSDGGGDGGGGGGGSGWRDVSSPTMTAALRGVFGSDDGALFAVGAASTILRLSASAPVIVESAPAGDDLRAVWAGGGAAFAVGDSGVVLTRGASGWDGFGLVDATFYAVSPMAESGPLVVGSAGTVMEHTATGWTADNPAVAVQLRGAWARPAGDVLVVGDGGTILRAVGAAPPLSWTVEQSGAAADLYAVWATATDAWAVGAGGTVLHAGSNDAWTVEASATTVDLFGVFGAGDVVWAVGAGGTIIARRDGAWSVERTGGADLRSVWASAADAWAVGDGGAILHRAP
jgi:hypothetical protein